MAVWCLARHEENFVPRVLSGEPESPKKEAGFMHHGVVTPSPRRAGTRLPMRRGRPDRPTVR